MKHRINIQKFVEQVVMLIFLVVKTKDGGEGAGSGSTVDYPIPQTPWKKYIYLPGPPPTNDRDNRPFPYTDPNYSSSDRHPERLGAIPGEKNERREELEEKRREERTRSCIYG